MSGNVFHTSPIARMDEQKISSRRDIAVLVLSSLPDAWRTSNWSGAFAVSGLGLQTIKDRTDMFFFVLHTLKLVDLTPPRQIHSVLTYGDSGRGSAVDAWPWTWSPGPAPLTRVPSQY